MSLHCVLDVALFLERFRNIDLFQQGLYCVRFTLEARTRAHPYDSSKAGFAELNQLHALLPPKTSAQEQAFLSSVFLIRYTEEEALLRELCLFRLELEPQQDAVLEATLLYSELDGDLEPATLPDRVRKAESVTFRQISNTQFRLKRPQQGLHEYVPLLFDEMHCALVVTSIHCALRDFHVESTGQKEDFTFRLAKTLFQDKRQQPKQFIGAGEVDKAYRETVGWAASGHEKMRSLLAVLHDKEEEDLPPDLVVPPPLSLPIRLSPTQEQVSRFSEAVSSHDPVQVTTALVEELGSVAGQVFHLFHQLLRAAQLRPVELLRTLMERHLEQTRERLRRSWIKSVHQRNEPPVVIGPEVEEQHRILAESRRANPKYQHPESFPIECMKVPRDPLPIIFEDTYTLPTAVYNSKSVDESIDPISLPDRCFPGQKHVFVLVHGFQGRSFDVHLLKHAICIANPDALVLASAANERNTEGDLEAMGVKLAEEVKAYLAEWCPGRKLGRLSFIGHSLGGLIVRSALRHLQDYAEFMHLLLTLSSPHLGYMHSTSKLVEAGIWVLKKWKGSAALQQLSMTDDTQLTNTALYSLSASAGLNWFQYVVLCSSHQDQYVPHASARIELTPRTPVQSSSVYQDMASRILSQVPVDRLYRLDVNFKLNGRGLDMLIGRTAHIQFLENEQFLDMLVKLYPEFFGGL